MVSVTSEEQFYAVAQFVVPDCYVGDMYDSYGSNTVIVVDVDRWYYVNFEKALTLKEEFGFPISFEEFEMRYLETVPTDNVMTHNDEVKTIKYNNTIHVNVGSKTWDKYMEELNKEDDIAGDSTKSQDEAKLVSGVKCFRGSDSEATAKYAEEFNKKIDMINHPSHYKQFGREVIDTMQGMSTPEEFKGYLKLNAIKYLSRYQGKNGVEDLDKAIWYVSKLKEVLEGEK